MLWASISNVSRSWRIWQIYYKEENLESQWGKLRWERMIVFILHNKPFRGEPSSERPVTHKQNERAKIHINTANAYWQWANIHSKNINLLFEWPLWRWAERGWKLERKSRGNTWQKEKMHCIYPIDLRPANDGSPQDAVGKAKEVPKLFYVTCTVGFPTCILLSGVHRMQWAAYHVNIW